MKVNKVKIKKNIFFKLLIVKIRLYLKNNTIDVSFFIEQIVFKIKQIFKIIYKYHCCKKTILFIGFSDKLMINYNNFLRFTNHYYISKTFWVNGLMSNSKMIRKYNKSFVSYSNILDLVVKKKPDLVVVLYYNFDKKILNEILSYKIPIIRLDLFFKKINTIRNSNFLIKIFFNEFINILIAIIFSLLKKQIKSNFDILFKIYLKKNMQKKLKLFFSK